MWHYLNLQPLQEILRCGHIQNWRQTLFKFSASAPVGTFSGSWIHCIKTTVLTPTIFRRRATGVSLKCGPSIWLFVLPLLASAAHLIINFSRHCNALIDHHLSCYLNHLWGLTCWREGSSRDCICWLQGPVSVVCTLLVPQWDGFSVWAIFHVSLSSLTVKTVKVLCLLLLIFCTYEIDRQLVGGVGCRDFAFLFEAT